MTVYERHTLSNGLRVLTAPLDHAQSVACYVMVGSGSRYENASNRGIAPARLASADDEPVKAASGGPKSRVLTPQSDFCMIVQQCARATTPPA